MNYFKVQARGLAPRFFFYRGSLDRGRAEHEALETAACTRGEICVWREYPGNTYPVIGDYPSPKEWQGPVPCAS